jgi:hypothetical protein
MNTRVLTSIGTAALLTATLAARQQESPQQPTKQPSAEQQQPGAGQQPAGGQQRTQPTQPLAGAADRAQDRTQSDPSAAAQITLVGCVQRESDYRQGLESTPAVSGTAASDSNQFVLINASMDTAAGAGRAGQAVGTSGTASAQTMTYGLGGTRNADLARHVGKRVEVKGAVSAADPKGSTAGASPTRPITQTITVSSVREIAGDCKM